MKTVIPATKEQVTIKCDFCDRVDSGTEFPSKVEVKITGSHLDYYNKPVSGFSRTLDVCNDCYSKLQAALDKLRRSIQLDGAR